MQSTLAPLTHRCQCSPGSSISLHIQPFDPYHAETSLTDTRRLHGSDGRDLSCRKHMHMPRLY